MILLQTRCLSILIGEYMSDIDLQYRINKLSDLQSLVQALMPAMMIMQSLSWIWDR